MPTPTGDSTPPTPSLPLVRLTGLGPVADARTVVLVLGSFPGVASLRAQQYYAHPHNQFWPVLQALWPQHPLPGRDDYAARCAWLLARGLGLWDVYASCEREGSLDSAIRNPVVNDFAGLRARCPSLKLALHNGGESFKHARPVAALGLATVRLPSTSPANAVCRPAEKTSIWLAALGLPKS